MPGATPASTPQATEPPESNRKQRRAAAAQARKLHDGDDFNGMTREELLNLGPTTDVPTAGRALGLGRATAYQLAQRGELPVTVLRLGSKLRVVTSSLMATLGIEESA